MIDLPPGFAEHFGNQIRRLTLLAQLGFQPRAILDVGAYHGGWSTVAKAIWPQAQIKAIEANEACRPYLVTAGHDFDIAVLSDTEGDATFHVCDNGCGEGNSLYRENSIHGFTPQTVQTKTLAGLLGDQTFDFIKMDCQGAELRIIAGGEALIQRAHLVMLETQLQDYNEGAPGITDVIAYMAPRGFRLLDIVDSHYNSFGLLIQTDLLFAKVNSPLFGIRPLS